MTDYELLIIGLMFACVSIERVDRSVGITVRHFLFINIHLNDNSFYILVACYILT